MIRILANTGRSHYGYVCPRCLRCRVLWQPLRRNLHATVRRAEAEQGVLEFLEQRGYVQQIAGDRHTLSRLLQRSKVGFYAGIDPTAPSLHLGHLLPLMVLFWLYHYGHSIVSLIGGATARVGDPSGRLTSRAQTAESVHETNSKTMFKQVSGLWENATLYARRHGYTEQDLSKRHLLNNADWLHKLNLLDFLEVLGNGMRVSTMLGRETVRNKLENGDGMSFSEFTYPLLQGWDWWHMYQHYGMQVQIGGSDQFGNIIAGMDGVRYIAQSTDTDGQWKQWLDAEGKLKAEHAPMGLTTPLLTTASGDKFGKSAGNAVWLDPTMTTPFDLYGFLLRSSDDDVERYLKLFTFIPTTRISMVIEEHTTDPGKRKAQHLLASEVLELVHGSETAAKTGMEHQSLRNPTIVTASSGQHERTVLPASLVMNQPFSKILYHAGIAPTKSEGARMVAKGGVYVATRTSTITEPTVSDGLAFTAIHDQKPEEVAQHVTNGLLILRMGKWKVRIIEVTDDAHFEEKGVKAPGWEEYRASRPQKE